MEVQDSQEVEDMSGRIVIVDYGMGNISSIRNMIRYLGHSAVLSDRKEDILSAEKLILPGVGNYKMAMENIDRMGLRMVLDQAVLEEQIPILGICLGMQLLLNYSEEGNCSGLGWIKGNVRKFNLDTSKYKIPHMGWDYIHLKRDDCLVDTLMEKPRFYFVHSYYAECENRSDCIATTDYGIEFDSVIGRNNVWGVQFHPEKSHKYGMKVFGNYLQL